MLKIVAFGVGRGEVIGLFGDEGGDVFVALLRSNVHRLARHCGKCQVSAPV